MFRTCLRGKMGGLPKRPAHPRAARASRQTRRMFSDAQHPDPIEHTTPKVRILGPTLWSIAAVTTIYFGCAVYEIRRNTETARAMRKQHPNYFGSDNERPITFADVENARGLTFFQDVQAQQSAHNTSFYDVLNRLAVTESGRFLLATGALNSGIFVISQIPSIMQRFVHIPALSSNYTLLTSMFAHAGLLHFGFNMYGLVSFGPATANGKTFERSGSHFAAFYLSSGILASLAHHISTAIVPAQRAAAFGGSLGASGAIFALVSAFAFQYPEAKVGIIFLPFYFPAQQALAGFALYDLYGMLVGFKSLRFAHAAHLGGMAIGSAYVAFDGNRRIWKPTRRLVFNIMMQLNLL
jgi:rhomboid-like protein